MINIKKCSCALLLNLSPKHKAVSKLESLTSVLERELGKNLDKLGVALSEALTRSPEMMDTVQKIQDRGCELLFVIEAETQLEDEADPEDTPVTNLRLTIRDKRFLRQMGISPE